MKAENKYLIVDNVELANDHIEQINEHLILKINAIASAIKDFGIAATKPMVLCAISNPNNIISAYRQAQEIAESERRKTMGDDQYNAMKSAMADLSGEKERHDAMLMDNLCTKCNEIKNGTFDFYNGMRISNPAILEWFDMDDDGNAFIPDVVKESIREEQRKYIETSVGKELRDLQIDIAAKLEKMYRYMQTTDNARKTCLDYDAKAVFMRLFPGGLFEYKDVNGFMHIIPRPLNFDPVDRDDIL